MFAPPSRVLATPTREGSDQAWRETELPRTWPDHSALRLFFSLLRAPFVRGGRVQVPAELPGPEIPAYALQPFHGLPNGYYSHSVADGYDRGFEISMLGLVARARRRMVAALFSFADGPITRALDLGCGGGRLAKELARSGVEHVFGLDPSPYMLQIAEQRTPAACLLQGVAESAPFENGLFDAIGSCFLFHELPREAAEASLSEIHRLLRQVGSSPSRILVATTSVRPASYDSFGSTAPWHCTFTYCHDGSTNRSYKNGTASWTRRRGLKHTDSRFSPMR